VSTVLLVPCLIGILAFAAWVVTRDTRKRIRQSNLSAARFWRQEAVSYLTGLRKLAILAATSMLIKAWYFDGAQEVRRVDTVPVPVAQTHSRPAQGNRTGERE
jgi:hypothetical protein